MRSFFDAETVVTTAKGALGLGATGGSFYVSFLPKVEAWLRLISLLLGIAVGVATLVSILRNKKDKKHKKNGLARILDNLE
jgi:hypothetical protein